MGWRTCFQALPWLLAEGLGCMLRGPCRRAADTGFPQNEWSRRTATRWDPRGFSKPDLESNIPSLPPHSVGHTDHRWSTVGGDSTRGHMPGGGLPVTRIQPTVVTSPSSFPDHPVPHTLLPTAVTIIPIKQVRLCHSLSTNFAVVSISH